jgi:hypothetical protein
MVEAYLDESGIHDGAHVCSIAGFWAMKKRWVAFDRCWKKVLEDADTPSLNEFHGHEFWGRRNGKRVSPYEKWDDSKADRFIEELLSCIVEHKVTPMAATLVVSEWRKLNKNERMLLTGGKYDRTNHEWITASAPNKTYFLPFQFCVCYPALRCQAGLHVRYVFDLNKQFKNHATQLFRLMKNDVNLTSRHRMGRLDLKRGEDLPGLQAADMLAYQIYQNSKLRIRLGRALRQTELDPVLQRLLTNKGGARDFPFFDFEGLNVALHQLPPGMRSAGWHPVSLKQSK